MTDDDVPGEFVQPYGTEVEKFDIWKPVPEEDDLPIEYTFQDCPVCNCGLSRSECYCSLDD